VSNLSRDTRARVRSPRVSLAPNYAPAERAGVCEPNCGPVPSQPPLPYSCVAVARSRRLAVVAGQAALAILVRLVLVAVVEFDANAEAIDHV
jgi:hypothetical protein